MPVLLYITYILVNTCQQTSAGGICLSLHVHVMSIFSLLLLLLLSVNLLSAEFSDCSTLGTWYINTTLICRDVGLVAESIIHDDDFCKACLPIPFSGCLELTTVDCRL